MFESFDTISAAQVPAIEMRYSEMWKLDEPAFVGSLSCPPPVGVVSLAITFWHSLFLLDSWNVSLHVS